MRIRILLLALVALGGPMTAGTAIADAFPVIVKAYETTLPTLRLPASVNGTLSFKACDRCEYQTVRVTPATRYEANGRVYELADFRKALAGIGNTRNAAVTVKHHLESNTIKAINVTTFRNE